MNATTAPQRTPPLVCASELMEATVAFWGQLLSAEQQESLAQTPLVTATRAARRDLLAELAPSEAWVQLRQRADGLSLRALFAAVLDSPGKNEPSSPAEELVAAIGALLDGAGRSGQVTEPAAEDVSRLREIDALSNYWGSERLPARLTVTLWPLRSMDPAPAGKIGALRGEELHLAFGEAGHVGSAGTLSWPQWYRLGVWHSLLSRAWGPAIQRVFDADRDELQAALLRLPIERRTVVGAHDFALKQQTTWPSYFADRLVSAGKAILERDVAGEQSGREQVRWLTSLGRADLDWFVDAMQSVELLEQLDLAALAESWKRDRPGEQATRCFRGPLAACENPTWNAEVAVAFGPSVTRQTRRALAMWFRSYWAVRPKTLELNPSELAPKGPSRLTFALEQDDEWIGALLSDVELAGLDGTVTPLRDLFAGAEPFGITLIRSHDDDAEHWSRVCVATDEQTLIRAHRDVRYYSDWTAHKGDQRSYGDVIGRGSGLTLRESGRD